MSASARKSVALRAAAACTFRVSCAARVAARAGRQSAVRRGSTATHQPLDMLCVARHAGGGLVGGGPRDVAVCIFDRAPRNLSPQVERGARGHMR